jgi:hypothetical protein
MEPEQKLWQQVVFRALCDALGFTNLSRNSPDRPRIVDEARLWFFDLAGDLNEVCRLAGLDAEKVRRSGVDLIEAQQSGDHSRVPAFWREAFLRNRMPSFTAYSEQIDKALSRK